MNYADQALSHQDINGDNPIGDVFCLFPWHPYMDGVSLPSGGSWQAGDEIIVFADGSKLAWNNNAWEIGMFDIEESLEGENEEDVETVKKAVETALMEKAFETALAEVASKHPNVKFL